MSLKEFLKENNTVKVGVEVATWQEAVRVGVDLLKCAGVVEERYYQAILDSTEKNGAYYLLEKGFAMPHARPEQGAIKTGFSLVVLKTPVEFSNEENDPVRIVLTVAGKDNKEFSEYALVEIMELLDDPDKRNRLALVSSVEEFFEVI